MIPLAVVKKPGIALVEEALREGKPIGLAVLKDRETENPGPDDVRRVGTIGTIQKMLKVPDGTLRCIVAGQARLQDRSDFRKRAVHGCDVHRAPDVTVENEELVAMQRNLAALFQKLLVLFAASAARDGDGSHRTSPIPNCSRTSSRRRCVSTRPIVKRCSKSATPGKRMRKLTMLLTKELEVVELGHKIQTDIQREMEKNQREFYLRQQLRAIQEELGEVDPQQAETNELRKKIDEAKMPEDVKKAADRELDRLSKVPQASPEYSVIRTYLDWLVQLPWSKPKRRTTSTLTKRARSSTRITTISRRSRTASSSTWPSASSRRS